MTGAGGSAPPLSRSVKLWYGLGQFAEGLKAEAFALLLLFYYTSVAGLAGELAGAAILIALLSDAITDPLVGVLSDRFHSRWGRRHPFMLGSALPVAAFLYLAFSPPPGLSQWGLFAWLAVFSVLCRVGITFFYVPHMALGAELSSQYEERTSIVTTRFYFARVGHAAAGALALLVFMRPTADFENGLLNPHAYSPYAACLALLVVTAIALSAWRTRSRIPYLVTHDVQASDHHVLVATLRDIWEAFHYRAFRALFVGSTLSHVAWGVTTALSLHFASYFWRITTYDMFLYGVGNGIGIFVGLDFWRRMADRFDKKPVFITGLVIYVTFLSGGTFLKLLGWWPAWGTPAYVPTFVLVVGLAAHFGLSATMATGGSMMADVTDEDQLRQGRRREGIFFAAVSFTQKASFGIGSLLAGLVVAFVGLEANLDPADAAPEVANTLGLTLGIAILVLVGLSIAAFSRYDLSRESHARVRAALDAAGAIDADSARA
jgi:Na+/melibiose symporter-like transporter